MDTVSPGSTYFRSGMSWFELLASSDTRPSSQ